MQISGRDLSFHALFTLRSHIQVDSSHQNYVTELPDDSSRSELCV